MEEIEIAVIINSFNRVNLLKESIYALADWIPKSEFANRVSIVVFEAGSSDGSIDWLQCEGQKQGINIDIILPATGADTSFAAGLNSGVSFAEKQFLNLKYLLFYETDNQISTSNPLEDAIAILNNYPKLGACGFTVKKHSGVSAGIGTPFPSLFNFLLGKNVVSKLNLEKVVLRWIPNEVGVKFSYVDCVYTSPLLVKVEAWKISGGLDKRVFPFSDCDVEWAKRLNKLGWKMGVVEATGVIHDNRETLSVWSGKRSMQFHRGRLRYMKRFYPYLTYLVWPLPLMVRHIMELLLTQIIIKNSKRRKQLTSQFLSLFKRCTYNYN